MGDVAALSFFILEDPRCFKQRKRPTMWLVWFFGFTNCLIVTPTHDAYLENGTCIGLTVGESIVAYAERFVNMRKILVSISETQK